MSVIDDTDDDDTDDEQYYAVRYELWPEENGDASYLGRHVETEVRRATSRVDAVNAMLYYVRGRKSEYELAAVHDVSGPYPTREAARKLP